MSIQKTGSARKALPAAAPKRSKASPQPLSDEHLELLGNVWAYLLVVNGQGKGISPEFKKHRFAHQLCYPRAGKHSTDKPETYWRFAQDPELRPWRGAERDLIFVVLTSAEWNDDAKTFTHKRPISELAAQMSCGRTAVNDAIDRQRVSSFPVLKIDNTPAFERDGQRYKGALTFSLIGDPVAFASARDKSPTRLARQTAEERRARELHGEKVRLQIARDQGTITPEEYRKLSALLAHRIKWGTAEKPAPLTAVPADDVILAPATPVQAPLPPMAIPSQADAAGSTAPLLRKRERWEAFDRVCAVYPKPMDLEADGRRRARERWEMLPITAALVDVIIRSVEARRLGPWSDRDVKYWPDLHSYLRDEMWTVPVTSEVPPSRSGGPGWVVQRTAVAAHEHPSYGPMLRADRAARLLAENGQVLDVEAVQRVAVEMFSGLEAPDVAACEASIAALTAGAGVPA